MPSSTPIYGFPYPLGTDPVGQGAQDIEDLATAVEQYLETYQGLVKIVPSSVSGTGTSISPTGTITVASGSTTFTITDCFNANFEAYQIVFSDMTLSVDAGINVQLRTSAGSTSNTGYYWGWLIGSGFYSGTGTQAQSSANQGSHDPRILADSGGGSGAILNVFNPFLSKRTSFSTSGADARIGGASVFGASGFHNVSTSYTSLVVNSGGASFVRCRVAIYGYNQ